MTFEKSRITQIQEAQNEISDCQEAIIELEGVIKNAYVFDRHALEMQNWIKEYHDRIGYLENFIGEGE